MQIVHVMTKHPETIRPDDTLAKAKEMMDAGEFRGLTVTVDGRVVGMLTERDLHGHGGYLHSTRVDAAMKSPVITVHTNTSVEDAAHLMLKHKISGLPVVDDGKLVGIVTTSDMLMALLGVIDTIQRKGVSA